MIRTHLCLSYKIYTVLLSKKSLSFLLVEGDAKLYEVLQAIKFEYGHEHDWLLPLPGDWYLLKNFQIALMKPYFDAGLKELAKVSGYSVAAIQACSKFKKTHYFIKLLLGDG